MTYSKLALKDGHRDGLLKIQAIKKGFFCLKPLIINLVAGIGFEPMTFGL